ncbi:uncharacterized protein LOC124791574 isoform X2 [Schistocerca piceifrons]|uniref:uncharacterized protein LOC124791574 isoform X2 n=1 Tax=Schistocerca piceifrons TaxID=274613 RepID=UPI001F5E6910|nr:uncharacterized protein LOC124791574 isoform X2 [Schistocerca piceifrons]
MEHYEERNQSKGSALIVSLWCYSSFMKFFNYKETQALPTAGIISQIISTLQYLLLGLLLRSVYEVYRAMIAIYTYFEAELWPTVLLVLECSLLGISLPILPIHPMIFIMLMWWLLPYTYMLMKLYKTYKRLQYINDCRQLS